MILDDIIANKKIEIEKLKAYFTPEDFLEKISHLKKIRDFEKALVCTDGRNPVRIIAEVKKASPSKGVLKEDFYPFDIALQYEAFGAAAISVVTEEKFFKGRFDYLQPICQNLNIPVLRKDFIIDDLQVYETRAGGADAILLIVAILGKERLKELMRISAELNMPALVEVHNEAELEVALDADAKIIGVNNRDLKTFKTDINTTIRLAPYVPKDKVLVSESGINTFEDVLLLMENGANAFLIGETLVKEKNIGKKLKELRGLGS